MNISYGGMQSKLRSVTKNSLEGIVGLYHNETNDRHVKLESQKYMVFPDDKSVTVSDGPWWVTELEILDCCEDVFSVGSSPMPPISLFDC